jgi:hypothetical protein
MVSIPPHIKHKHNQPCKQHDARKNNGANSSSYYHRRTPTQHKSQPSDTTKQTTEQPRAHSPTPERHPVASATCKCADLLLEVTATQLHHNAYSQTSNKANTGYAKHSSSQIGSYCEAKEPQNTCSKTHPLIGGEKYKPQHASPGAQGHSYTTQTKTLSWMHKAPGHGRNFTLL